jgi:hypothetical protein
MNPKAANARAPARAGVYRLKIVGPKFLLAIISLRSGGNIIAASTAAAAVRAGDAMFKREIRRVRTGRTRIRISP